LTHGDRDHIGGAHAMLRDFRPAEVWEGVPVEGHAETERLRSEATRRHMRWRIVQAGERLAVGDSGGADREAEPRVIQGGFQGVERGVARSAAQSAAQSVAQSVARDVARDVDRGEDRGEDREADGGLRQTAVDADADDVEIRVWHPSAPEWIRKRVRNDD